MGYQAGPHGFVTGPNRLDVSNSNTPGECSPPTLWFGSITGLSPKWTRTGKSKSRMEMPIAVTMAARQLEGSTGMYYLAGNDNNGGLSKTQLFLPRRSA